MRLEGEFQAGVWFSMATQNLALRPPQACQQKTRPGRMAGRSQAPRQILDWPLASARDQSKSSAIRKLAG